MAEIWDPKRLWGGGLDHNTRVSAVFGGIDLSAGISMRRVWLGTLTAAALSTPLPHVSTWAHVEALFAAEAGFPSVFTRRKPSGSSLLQQHLPVWYGM